MHRIMEVGVFSAGKVSGVMGVFVGLLIGLIYGGVLLAMGVVAMTQDGGGPPAFLFIGGAVGILIFAPILYGVISFIVGLLWAVVLNLVLPRVGGLELRIEKE